MVQGNTNGGAGQNPEEAGCWGWLLAKNINDAAHRQTIIIILI